MHVEFLVEDSSGAVLIENLVPQIMGDFGAPHTWRVHQYKGIGRLPNNLRGGEDPAKRALLNQLPRLLSGCGKTPGIDAVVVVVDSDRRNCRDFLQELKTVVEQCDQAPNTLFRLAIEEMEAWYLGDRNALLEAYPRAKKAILDRYQQDSICGTWELLADAIYPGGLKAVQKVGWPLPGQIKHEWAGRISPLMDVDRNASPSFCKFRDGLLRMLQLQ